MDDYVLLDILLGLIVALFAAIGFWRGAIKEVVVTVGIFVGSALAFSWADPWGRDLADLFNMRTDVARILVAAVALIAATLVLGYVGGSLVGSPDVGLSSRLLGAGLAFINGGLLLHYLLWNIERFLTDRDGQEALDRSHVSHLLLRQFGWLLIGSALLATLVIVGGQMIRRRRAFVPLIPVSETVETVPASAYDANGRPRPARLPRVADTGKYEPVTRGYDPVNERFDADTPSPTQTIPLPPVNAEKLANGGGRGVPASNNFESEEWYRRSSRVNGRSSINRTGDDDAPVSQSDANGHSPLTDMSPYSWVKRAAHPDWRESTVTQNGANQNGKRSNCPACRTEVGSDDSFCPRCGTSVE